MTTVDWRARLQSIFLTTVEKKKKKSNLVVYSTERFRTEINNRSVYLPRDDWSVDLCVKRSRTTATSAGESRIAPVQEPHACRGVVHQWEAAKPATLHNR